MGHSSSPLVFRYSSNNNNNIIIIIMNCKFLHSAWQIIPSSHVVLTLCFPQSPEATGVLFVNDMTPDEEGKVCGRILSQKNPKKNLMPPVVITGTNIPYAIPQR